MRGSTDQAKLVQALARSIGSPAASAANVLETHISYVLLTGDYAYKVKKAVAFGFLDFTTLAARRFFCDEELRLNRRLAPGLYLDVVPITGSIDAPQLGGQGTALEYAVKMREFPQSELASELLARGELDAGEIDALAANVADFHAAIAMAEPAGPFGTPDGILRLARRNFDEIAPLLATDDERGQIESLRGWTAREHARRKTAFERRRTEGFVRECHGDLHLGNIARIDGKLVIFDCIEFNEEMRWIDVMSESAFTVMDLEDRGRADLAYRFLDGYLGRTGDYAGLAVLPFYLAYRALVRAKVALLRAAQAGAGATAARTEARGYLRLASKYATPPAPALIITTGLSGSGKTTLSGALLERIGAVRVRSDVERKRMHGLAPRDRAGASIDGGLYSPAATDLTYERLRAVARDVIDAGRIAIVDAAFPRRAQRESFRALADELGVPFAILAFEAREATLRQRIAARHARATDASDADLAVLAHQIATREPLAADERTRAVVYDAEAPVEAARTPAAWRELTSLLAARRT
ncbi:MAG TPA: AAA family ATPase [Casimicrobiaceae bacterium]|nr:AAA family ATPase [Casimicrobiaceae bacterium]